MFKNLVIYRISSSWIDYLERTEEALENARYVACGASQEKATGWIEPCGKAYGPLVESVGGQWILKFMIEVKAVPGSVLNRKAKERVAQIEQTTGRKPGKKEVKEIKEEVKQTLLPMAFSKQVSVLVWIDVSARLMLVDASSQGRADEVVTALVNNLEGFKVALVDTQISPVAAMADWLTTQEPPAGFNIEQECELKATDESKAVVRYGRHPLDIDEVKQHIAQGKLPTKLALTWNDRVTFSLTDSLQLKKLSFHDVVFDGTSADDGGFDADVSIATGELARLLPDLFEGLGGEAQASHDA